MEQVVRQMSRILMTYKTLVAEVSEHDSPYQEELLKSLSALEQGLWMHASQAPSDVVSRPRTRIMSGAFHPVVPEVEETDA